LAKEALPVIANDIYLSCLREARYKSISILPPESSDSLSPVEKNEIVAKINALEQQISKLRVPDQTLVEELKKLKLQLLTSNSELIDLQSRLEAQKKCDIEAQKIGPQMIVGNSIIILYIQKLGEIASEDLIDFNSQFDELKVKSDSLSDELFGLLQTTQGEQGLIKKQVNAGLDLANFILKEIFEGKRRDTLSEVIPKANIPLKTYAMGLETVVQKVYIDTYLRSEEAAVDNYFIDYIEEILDSKTRKEGNSVITLANTLISLDQDRWNPKKDEIQKRRDLAYTYISLLKTIVSSHEELAAIYNEGKQPSTKALESLLDKNTTALKEYIKQSKELSNKSLE
jgi:hypothetical protein